MLVNVKVTGGLTALYHRLGWHGDILRGNREFACVSIATCSRSMKNRLTLLAILN